MRISICLSLICILVLIGCTTSDFLCGNGVCDEGEENLCPEDCAVEEIQEEIAIEEESIEEPKLILPDDDYTEIMTERTFIEPGKVYELTIGNTYNIRPILAGNKVFWKEKYDSSKGGPNYSLQMFDLITRRKVKISDSLDLNDGLSAKDGKVYWTQYSLEYVGNNRNRIVNPRVYEYDPTTGSKNIVEELITEFHPVLPIKYAHEPSYEGGCFSKIGEIGEFKPTGIKNINHELYYAGCSDKKYALKDKSSGNMVNVPIQLFSQLTEDYAVGYDYSNEPIEDHWEGNADILLFDVEENKIYQVTKNKAKQSYPFLSSDIFVWQDNRNGYEDIFIAVLSNKSELNYGKIRYESVFLDYQILTSLELEIKSLKSSLEKEKIYIFNTNKDICFSKNKVEYGNLNFYIDYEVYESFCANGLVTVKLELVDGNITITLMEGTGSVIRTMSGDCLPDCTKGDGICTIDCDGKNGCKANIIDGEQPRNTLQECDGRQINKFYYSINVACDAGKPIIKNQEKTFCKECDNNGGPVDDFIGCEVSCSNPQNCKKCFNDTHPLFRDIDNYPMEVCLEGYFDCNDNEIICNTDDWKYKFFNNKIRHAEKSTIHVRDKYNDSECTDSDGGTNEYETGIVTGPNPGAGGATMNRQDHCWNDGTPPYKLTEYYCKNGQFAYLNLYCDWGYVCNNGACVKSD